MGDFITTYHGPGEAEVMVGEEKANNKEESS
jgi:hypothetical protein